MKKSLFAFGFLLAAISIFGFIPKAQAATLADRLSGRIVLDVEAKGEAWYINPGNKTRYYLGHSTDAIAAMRQLGVGISEGNFQKIAQAGTTGKSNAALAKSLAGKIILQVERRGEAWYVNPVDLKKYYLGRPADAFAVMRQLGLGIKHADLAKIPRAFKDDAANTISNFKYQKKISLPYGSIGADVVEISLSKLGLKITSDTAGVENCSSGCPAKALYDYVYNQKAFAAINGVAVAPFYNTLSDRMINENKLGSFPALIAFDTNNKFYYYTPASRFSAVNFPTANGAQLSAAFVGRAKLVEDGVVKNYSSDGRMARNAFGFKRTGLNPEGTVYLVSLHSATTGELAKVMKALGCDYAISLDGGNSSALYYNTEYKIGPNSNVQNAILFIVK
jgi:hypothetical protein